jgi:hypothetical protein
MGPSLTWTMFLLSQLLRIQHKTFDDLFVPNDAGLVSK